MISTNTKSTPEQWKVVRLLDVASCNDDVLSETTDPDFEFNYIEIGDVQQGSGITNSTLVTFSEAPSRARRLVKSGDTIISTVRTYLEAVAPITEDFAQAVVSTGFAVIRPLDGVHPQFIQYVLQSKRFIAEVVARSEGVSYPAIPATKLVRIPISIPPIERQRTIAAYLDRETARIDGLIAAKERLLDVLTEKRQALITEAVTRGLDPSFSLVESGDARLGQIPVNWRLLQLRRVFRSVDYGTSETTTSVGSIAILRMGDIQGGELNFNNLAFLNDVPANLLLRTGDLLFNRTNSLEQIGKVALYRGNYSSDISFASYLVRLRCNETCLPEYLNYLLNTASVLAWGRKEALPAIGQANLNPNRYGYMQIALPPKNEQEGIIQWIQTHDQNMRKVLQATRSSLKSLRERRASLIAAAVTGQMDMARLA